VSIRNDKSNDSGNEMVKVCSNRTTITKEHTVNPEDFRLKNYEKINLIVWLNQELVLIYY